MLQRSKVAFNNCTTRLWYLREKNEPQPHNFSVLCGQLKKHLAGSMKGLVRISAFQGA